MFMRLQLGIVSRQRKLILRKLVYTLSQTAIKSFPITFLYDLQPQIPHKTL